MRRKLELGAIGLMVILTFYAGGFFTPLASAISVLLPYQGGTGSSSTPSTGDILVGKSGGTYTPTSSISVNNIVISGTCTGCGSGLTSINGMTGPAITVLGTGSVSVSSSTNTLTINGSGGGGGSGSISTSSAVSVNNYPFWTSTSTLSGSSTLSVIGTQLLQNGAFNASGTISQSGTAVVLQTRNINTTAPLGGGGALSGDLTLTCLTCQTVTSTIISSGGTATGPAFTFSTTTAVGIWNVTSSGSGVRFTLPSNVSFFSNDVGYGLGNVFVKSTSSIVALTIPYFPTGASSTLATTTFTFANGGLAQNGTSVIDGGGNYAYNVVQNYTGSVIIQNVTGTTSVGNFFQGGGVAPIETTTHTLTGSDFCGGGFIPVIATSAITVTFPSNATLASTTLTPCAANGFWAGSFSQQFVRNSSTVPGGTIAIQTNGPGQFIEYAPGTPTVLNPGETWSIVGQVDNTSTVQGLGTAGATFHSMLSLYSTSTITNALVVASSTGRYVGYAGSTACAANQFINLLSATGTVTCATPTTGATNFQANGSVFLTTSTIGFTAGSNITITTSTAGVYTIAGSAGGSSPFATSTAVTSGYFLSWTSTSTFNGTSTIFQNGLNTGIGTVNPSSTLHIVGGQLWISSSTTPSTNVLKLSHDGTNGSISAGTGSVDFPGRITIAANSSNPAAITLGGLYGIYSSGAGLAFANSGTGKMSINSDGPQIGMNSGYMWTDNTAQDAGTRDLFLMRGGVATLRHGAADAATPIPQTIIVQGGSGTDKAGAAWTFIGSRGTGTGVGGNLIFQIATASTTSNSTLNVTSTVMTITEHGHVEYSQPTIPVVSSCGTGALVATSSADEVGNLVVGGSVTASCTITFKNTWTNIPSCYVTDSTGFQTIKIVATTSTAVFSVATDFGGDTLRWGCKGYKAQ